MGSIIQSAGSHILNAGRNCSLSHATPHASHFLAEVPIYIGFFLNTLIIPSTYHARSSHVLRYDRAMQDSPLIK